MPTQVVIPTNTPAPPTETPLPPTLTPTQTQTPSQTPTPTASRTPRPTFTPVVTEVAATCRELLSDGLAFTQFNCDDARVDRVCYGSAFLESEIRETAEGNSPLRFPGTSASTDDIEQLSVGALDPEEALWGLALVRLGSDRNRPFPNLDYISLVLFGGTRLQNVTPAQSVQEENRRNAPVGQQERLRPPMSSFTLATTPTNTDCGFVPVGALLQAPASARPEGAELIINGVTVTFDGTLYIASQPGADMIVSVLEGSASLALGETVQEMITGTQSIVVMTDDLAPLTLPSEMAQYNPNDVRSIFEGASDIFTLLDREISLPAAPSASELALLNTLSGTYTVQTRFTRLDGLLSEGDTPDSTTIAEAQQFCRWTAGQQVGFEYTLPFEIVMDEDEEFFDIQASYPGVLFPPRFIRLENTQNTYTATDETSGAKFEHVITFVSRTELTWRLEAFNLPGTRCTGGVIVGEGAREAPVSVQDIASTSFEVWEMELTLDDFYVPRELILLDCPADDLLTPDDLPGTLLLNVVREDETVSAQSNFAGITLPPQLTQDAANPDVYTGEATNAESGQQFFHRLEFVDESNLLWRLMVRDTAGNCRLGAIEARGLPFAQ